MSGLDPLRKANLEYNLRIGPWIGIAAGVLLIPLALYLQVYFLLIVSVLTIPACAWVLRNQDRLRQPDSGFLNRRKRR